MGVGLSALMGLQAATFFMVFTYLSHLGFVLMAIPILYASLVYFSVAIAAHPSINLPILLGKSTDGRFPIWSLIMLSPYLYFVRLFSALRRLRSGEAPYSEISEGLFVGGWPYSFDNLPPGNLAIIDCTCEFPRKMELSGHAYLCIPTWDTRSPQPAEIESAVKWACRKRAQKIPIFVHCAYGMLRITRNSDDELRSAVPLGIITNEKLTDHCHGRSVAVMCALLIALGLAEDWKNAEKLIQEKRPCIQMNGLHRKALEEWSKRRLSSPAENHEVGVSSIISS